MCGSPLDTKEAVRLLRIVKTSGARTIVFAGGDPSLRTDIFELVTYAQKIGLGVEIQTNAHFQPPSFLCLLADVNLVGLSLDAHEAELHDGFRGRKGNFKQVCGMLDFLRQKGVPVIVRSLITVSTHKSVPQLAVRLKEYPNLIRWSLLEFTPIGKGFENCDKYALDRALYESSVALATSLAGEAIKVDVYRNEDKTGTYALVTPDGQLYGTGSVINGDYPKVGSMLQTHLDELARRLTFIPENHARRYGTLPIVVGSDHQKPETA